MSLRKANYIKFFMNLMKANKGYLFVMLALMIGIGMTGCSTYPDGPTISIKSKEARIAGTWKIVQATNDDGEDVTDNFESWRYTFSEDGDAVLNITEGSASFELTGTWTLSDDELTFNVQVEGSTLGGIISSKQDKTFNILRLTDKQFWLEDVEDQDATFSLEPF